MTVAGWIIALALVVIWVADTSAGLLNLRRLRNPPPARFADLYDDAQYTKMRAYNGGSARLEIVESFVVLACLLTFWFAGGFAWLAGQAGGMSAGPVSEALIFGAGLWLASLVLRLPFSVYDTFVLEARHGFNKTGPALFAVDFFKSLLVSLVLGGLLGFTVIALFVHGGPLAWVWGAGVTAGFMVLLLFLAPRILLPLFNQFKPLPEGPLKDRILAFAAAHHFPVGEISVMDGSRRSTKANAFFTGFGKTKRIALFDNLVERFSSDELVAVLAHEIGHHRLRHIQSRMITIMALVFLYFAAAAWSIESGWVTKAFGVPDGTAGVALVLFGIAIKPVSWGTGILQAWVSRRHEFEADAFAAATTGSAVPLVHALTKLNKENLAHLDPHPACVALYYSHPPLPRRVAALESVPVPQL